MVMVENVSDDLCDVFIGNVNTADWSRSHRYEISNNGGIKMKDWSQVQRSGGRWPNLKYIISGLKWRINRKKNA